MTAIPDSDNGNDNKNEERGRLPFLPPEGWTGVYVAIFSVIMSVYCFILVSNPPADYIDQRGAGALRNLVNDLGFALPLAAFLAYLLTEGIRAMVFFSEKVRESRDRQRERFKAEGISIGKARGVAEGMAAKDAEWRAWYAEFKEAQREGRPFDKLPPGEHDYED